MTGSSRRFVIIKPCCIGDAVMALPVIENLKRAYPNTFVEVWCGTHAEPVFQSDPLIDSLVHIPNIPAWKDFPLLVRRFRASAGSGFFILDRSRLVDAAARVSRVSVLGSVRRTEQVIDHETDRYLDTLEQAGIPADMHQPSIDLTSIHSNALLRLADDLIDPYVVLHPGGAENPGTTMHSKRWPEDSWRRLIDWLDRKALRAILTGSPAEKPLCDEIAHGTTARVVAGDLSLIESAAVGARARAFVGPDTGLSHLVAASGTPTIAIFGPTNPRQYAPRGRHVAVLAPQDSYLIEDADLRKGQAGKRPQTSDVSVESVVGALDGMLSRSRVTS